MLHCMFSSPNPLSPDLVLSMRILCIHCAYISENGIMCSSATKTHWLNFSIKFMHVEDFSLHSLKNQCNSSCYCRRSFHCLICCMYDRCVDTTGFKQNLTWANMIAAWSPPSHFHANFKHLRWVIFHISQCIHHRPTGGGLFGVLDYSE